MHLAGKATNRTLFLVSLVPSNPKKATILQNAVAGPRCQTVRGQRFNSLESLRIPFYSF
jgi:hypothetical protein